MVATDNSVIRLWVIFITSMYFVVSDDIIIMKFKRHTPTSVKKAISGLFLACAAARQDLDTVSHYLDLLLEF